MKFEVYLTLSKAITTRILFATHNILTIMQVAELKKNPKFYFLGLTLIALVFETIFTMIKNKGQEWKWFSPSVFIFLAGSVPSIWFLELTLMQQEYVDQDDTPLNINNAGDRLEITEQVLVLVLIIGRWILPKGQISRDELSQLLLVYIGMAADILETFDVLEIKEVQTNSSLVLVILSLWTWSLLQFTIVMTAKKKRLTKAERLELLRQAERKERIFNRALFKRFHGIVGLAVTNKRLLNEGVRFLKPHPQVVIPVRPEDEINEEEELEPKCVCLESEVWAIVTTMLLQDGPFLILRLILIFHFNVVSQFNIFFVCKNSLVLCLQTYRLIVLQIEKKTKVKAESDNVQDMWAKGVQGNPYAIPRETSKDPYTGMVINDVAFSSELRLCLHKKKQ
ncbi:Transmembrane protein 26 [Holothuria leucospilota]|uniref:Transmembrane protein 26 n=1 Tax=Holothuria leucospilota TaxID=206669 RepID=A0A9Q1BBT1_HOLLE|nr:Transmembrane protein 26 [Holothuria leucospilota]